MPPRISGSLTRRLVSNALRSKRQNIICLKIKCCDFSSDQRGMETLQTLMILAIAAICLIVIKLWWEPLSEYFNSLFEIFLFQ